MLFPLASRVLVPLQLDSQRNIQEAGGVAVPAREGEAWPGTGAGWELPPLELLTTRPSVRGGGLCASQTCLLTGTAKP